MTSSSKLPGLMNSATYQPNGGPHGVLGAVGPRRLPTPESVKRAYGVDVTADELARNAVRRSDEAEPDKTEEPALWLHWADHRLREVAARHGCVRRDDATRIITDALALASDDDRTFDLDYLSEIVAREADATTERNNAKMDAQPPLIDDQKPTGNKSPFGRPVSEIVPTTERRAQPGTPERDAELPFMPPEAPAPKDDGKWYQDDKKLLKFWQAVTDAAFDVRYQGDVRALTFEAAGGLLSDWPGDAKSLLAKVKGMLAASQKPAEKAPARVETPAPATDVPAPRSDATAALETAIPAKPEPMPEPAQVAPAAPCYEEWPFVVLITLYSPEGLESKYTIRAASDAALLDAERAFVARRLAAGYTVTRQASSPVHQQTVSLPISQQTASLPATPQLPTTAAPLPETVPQAAPATGGAPDKKGRVPGQTGTDRVTAIARNETNGKSVIEVYCGGKYSDHKLRRDEDVAMLRTAFPALDIAAMTPGTQYPVTATLTWRVTDKLNDKGTYWRDVESITA